MISFNVPPFLGTEMQYVADAAQNRHKICGDGYYSLECHKWLEDRFGAQKALLTTSGTAALEMAAVLCDLKPGDEVILPSFTFSSTATAFQAVGATLVFVDVRPDTMNIDENLIEAAITPRTRVIVPVHYAGVACEMDAIMDIAARHNLLVVEDAAQGVMSTYKGRALGTIGTFGCFSFHETKNYSMGEGGALLINDPVYNDRAQIIREKGTDRHRQKLGLVDKYTWVDRGSSYLASDLNAAYLYGQLIDGAAERINGDRLATWDFYYEQLRDLQDAGLIELPVIPEGCEHNAHMFYLKCKDGNEREQFISRLNKEFGVQVVFHYIPLHSARAGQMYGRFEGKDVFTTADSERLVRLPMYYGLSADDRKTVVAAVREFYGA